MDNAYIVLENNKIPEKKFMTNSMVYNFFDCLQFIFNHKFCFWIMNIIFCNVFVNASLEMNMVNSTRFLSNHIPATYMNHSIDDQNPISVRNMIANMEQNDNQIVPNNNYLTSKVHEVKEETFGEIGIDFPVNNIINLDNMEMRIENIDNNIQFDVIRKMELNIEDLNHVMVNINNNERVVPGSENKSCGCEVIRGKFNCFMNSQEVFSSLDEENSHFIEEHMFASRDEQENDLDSNATLGEDELSMDLNYLNYY